MTMHNCPHPGEFINETYIKPFGISLRECALKLNVAHSTFSRLVKGQSHLTPEMALKLSKTFGRSPESWMKMQNNYDLWHDKKHVDLRRVSVINF